MVYSIALRHMMDLLLAQVHRVYHAAPQLFLLPQCTYNTK